MDDETVSTMACGCLTGAMHRRLIHNGIPAERHLETLNRKRNQGQEDDPSQHDIPRENEMKEINLGPVVNPDGSPSDVSLEMFGWTREQWNEKQKQEAADQAYNDPIDGYEAYLQQRESE